MQMTSDSRGNLCIDETNMNNALEATLEQVFCSWYRVWFRKD